MDLAPYTGQHARCQDPQHAAVLLENTTYSMSVYPRGTVDHVFFHQAVVLTEETAEALYRDFTPLDQPCTQGTRVFLEKIVDVVTAGLKTDRQKAIALCDWVRDIPRTYPNLHGEPFHGGAEEEVIRKGSNMCNEMARVLAILAQIAQIPSRYIGHMTAFDFDDPNSGSGHGVNELYIEGAWTYFDIRGKFFQKSDGQFASAWDLIRNPSIIDKQPPDVLSHMGRSASLDVTREYFSPPTVHIVVNYLAADHAKYDYSWQYPSNALYQRGRDNARRLRTTKHKDILPQPTVRV